MKKSKRNLPPNIFKSQNPSPNAKNDAVKDIQEKKVNRFTNIMTIVRDQMWQFWGFLLTLFVALASLIGYTAGLNTEKKIEPLSVPDNFVSYSNTDFALSLPYTVNQNKSFSSRVYGFNLDESGKDGRFLQIMVIEGKDIQPTDDDFSDSAEEISRSKEEMKKAMSQFGGNAMKMNLVSYEAEPFQGNKGKVIVWEAYTRDEETQVSEYIKFKMRMFFDEKTKRLYQIMYSPNPTTEQILSTLNFSKF